MLLLNLICLVSVSKTAAVPYEQYILAPSSRNVHPVSIHSVNGTVIGAESLAGTTNGIAIFVGNSAVTYDFGVNVGGPLTIQFAPRTSGCVGVTFTESSLWISGLGCDATADSGIDAPLWFCAQDADINGRVAADADHGRGAFRYMSVIRNGTGTTEITGLSIYFAAMPHIGDQNLKKYSGYFHSNDEKLNRVWYAGAYTNQLVTIDPTHGDALVHLGAITTGENITTPLQWYNNYTITNGTSCLTDGAKRDRLVWAGDMAVAVPSIAVSTNDLISVSNSLESIMILQASDGQLPYAGTPFNELGIVSATYHMYALLGISDYYHYSGDITFLNRYWDQWKRAMNYSLSFVDSSGLMNVTSPNDWLRYGMGGHNIEANSILYHTLNRGVVLAQAVNDSLVIEVWQNIAAGVKLAANRLLWSDIGGLYIDNETTTLSPQDGNAWAVRANLTDSTSKITSISSNLQKRWTKFGAPAPEAADAISPFISSFELETHFLALEPTRALDLIRFMWADFMLDDPRMTNSTFIEGYSTTGELHYAPYTNDPRISHAHGWATGPTSLLTFYVAGIQLLEAGGSKWLIAPQFGDLRSVQSGFETSLGQFTSSWELDKTRITLSFSAPTGTKGSIMLMVPECTSSVRVTDAEKQSVQSTSRDGRVTVDNLQGGRYRFLFECE